MKVKVMEYEGYSGQKEVQWAIKCPGCKKFHYLGPEYHAFNGDVDKPTFSPSVYKNWEPICHSFVKDGFIQFLGDCWHELKNQTVELPDIDLEEPC